MEINTIIERIRAEFTAEPQQIDFICATFIDGNHNKETRREIIKLTTGEYKPYSKCSLFAAANALKNYFNQPQLF
jgi:hypothetical protein